MISSSETVATLTYIQYAIYTDPTFCHLAKDINKLLEYAGYEELNVKSFKEQQKPNSSSYRGESELEARLIEPPEKGLVWYQRHNHHCVAFLEECHEAPFSWSKWLNKSLALAQLAYYANSFRKVIFLDIAPFPQPNKLHEETSKLLDACVPCVKKLNFVQGENNIHITNAPDNWWVVVAPGNTDKTGSEAVANFLFQLSPKNLPTSLLANSAFLYEIGYIEDELKKLKETRTNNPTWKSNVRTILANLEPRLNQIEKNSKIASMLFPAPNGWKNDIEKKYKEVKTSMNEFKELGEDNNMNNKPTFDIGIITVIGEELHAIQSALGVDNKKDLFIDDKTNFWEAKLKSGFSERELSILIHCISKPGNSESSNATSKIIERFKPKALFLMGIAAGKKGKVKIGDVVVPVVVVDDTLRVIEKNKLKSRPKIPSLPYVMSQMFCSYRLDSNKWHEKFKSIFNKEIIILNENQKDYEKHVSKLPFFSQGAIYSSDNLLKDSNVLKNKSDEIHEQIRIGEMEAGGFITACTERGTPIPWFIVRGVSDFGDKLKNDDFHSLASCAAASYLTCFLEDGFNLNLISHEKENNISVKKN